MSKSCLNRMTLYSKAQNTFEHICSHLTGFFGDLQKRAQLGVNERPKLTKMLIFGRCLCEWRRILKNEADSPSNGHILHFFYSTMDLTTNAINSEPAPSSDTLHPADVVLAVEALVGG